MSKPLAIILLVLPAVLLVLGLSGCGKNPDGTEGGEQNNQNQQQGGDQKTDDWQYKPVDYGESGNFVSSATGGMMKNLSMPMAAPTGSANLGLAVGGAKDVNNFRENIKNGYLPIPTDITYEGLFYNYFFDTGKTEQCDKLFCPSYSTAVSKDPLSKQPEYYLSVGLNSGIKEADFQRKKLNLVVVMDISGSMGSPFDQYYYDRFGNKVERQGEKPEEGKTKMQIANQSVVALLDHLKEDDRFGLVLFDDDSYVAKPLSRVGVTDMKKIKDHILELSERGGTYMESGMRDGSKMLQELSEANPDQYENRIIFITDAMPNIGDISEEGLGGMLKKNSQNHIYTTFVGVGVDFNTELVEDLTKIRGANYYSVHSDQEFKKVLAEDFDYMVTPLVFDLNLKLDAPGYEIEKVYGSPEADEATGEIMKVNTLFPSKTEEGQTKGGIILLKLNKKSGEIAANGKIILKVSYEDRNGKTDSSGKEIVFESREPDYFDNTGIRKAILLTRYANLIKGWLTDEVRVVQHPDVPCPPVIMYETGIRCPEFRCMPPMPPRCELELGEWERQSVKLQVAPEYRKMFRDFTSYFREEMTAIGDDSLKQELDILDKLE
jgi:Ca-activated chloride channel family protein